MQQEKKTKTYGNVHKHKHTGIKTHTNIIYEGLKKKIEEILLRPFRIRYRRVVWGGRNLGHDFFLNRLVQKFYYPFQKRRRVGIF
jgi:hypothetical protein